MTFRTKQDLLNYLLEYAVHNDSIIAAKILLHMGADINHDMSYCLKISIIHDTKNMSKFLLDNNADSDDVGNFFVKNGYDSFLNRLQSILDLKKIQCGAKTETIIEEQK